MTKKQLEQLEENLKGTIFGEAEYEDGILTVFINTIVNIGTNTGINCYPPGRFVVKIDKELIESDIHTEDRTDYNPYIKSLIEIIGK